MSVELAPKAKEGRAVYVLASLLVLHLGLLSLQLEDPAGTRLLKKWVLLAGAPFFDVSSRVTRTAGYLWRNYVWLHSAREENAQLRETIRQLSLGDRALAEMKEENIRLRGLLALEESIPLDSVTARVVGRVPNYLSGVIYISRGTADGIDLDSPVLSGSGVVGRVVLVSPHHAQVQLITNADASIGVMAERSRSPGVLKGTGGSLLELDYINNSEHIEVGDVVVTSGLDGIFPKGLLVGKVVDSRKGKSVFRSIKVEPAADLIRLEEVLVLHAAARPPLSQQQGSRQDPIWPCLPAGTARTYGIEQCRVGGSRRPLSLYAVSFECETVSTSGSAGTTIGGARRAVPLVGSQGKATVLSNRPTLLV